VLFGLDTAKHIGAEKHHITYPDWPLTELAEKDGRPVTHEDQPDPVEGQRIDRSMKGRSCRVQWGKLGGVSLVVQ